MERRKKMIEKLLKILKTRTNGNKDLIKPEEVNRRLGEIESKLNEDKNSVLRLRKCVEECVAVENQFKF